MGMFDGKVGLVMGVANDRSIAWAITQALWAEGAEIGFTHRVNPGAERRIRRLVEGRQPRLLMSCDVQSDADIARVFAAAGETFGRLDFLVHSIAFASPYELRRSYLETSRAGWQQAMDTSVYSLVAVCQAAAPLFVEGATALTITYVGGEQVVPGYNLMGVCKAALEHSVRYLAWDLGRRKQVRVNAISAGAIRTLSSAGIHGFDRLRAHTVKKSCLGRTIEGPELGSTALYLLGPLSSGVTGETVHVDCGYSIVGL
ncbi:MAG: enoyl-ACP reductase [Pirellulales bacterium]|nr:enoyl-ACP reductase [Pirellulales bacterium]